MITVASVLRSDGDYGLAYVERLAAAVKRNLRLPHKFVCLTNVSARRFWNLSVDEAIPLRYGWPDWWSKMELFGLLGPVLYFDLDTVITGNIDALAEWATVASESVSGRALLMLRGFYRNDQCSGIMAWGGDMKWILEGFTGDASSATWRRGPTATRMMGRRKSWRGDQEWLTEFLSARKDNHRVIFAQDIFGGIYSYKVDIQGNGSIPDDSKIVCFHGRPRPHDVEPIPKWMQEHWIGHYLRPGHMNSRQLKEMRIAGGLTNYPCQHSGTLLILGGAEGGLKELQEAHQHRPGAMVAAVGYAAGFAKADFLISDHYETHQDLRRLQDQFGGQYSTHCSLNVSACTHAPVDYWWNWKRAEASSVQTAIRIGLATGFDEIILCGCPLKQGEIQHPMQRKKDGNIWPPPRDIRRYGSKPGLNTSEEILRSFREHFASLARDWKGRVFSMSGFTRQILGAASWQVQQMKRETIERWSGKEAVRNVYPELTGKWPDEDSITQLRELCRDRVCDVGCGTGRCAEAFAPDSYVGLDINASAIRVAKKNYPEHKFQAINWEDNYPRADTYLFYTVFLHIPGECLVGIVSKVRKANHKARIVIFESMSAHLRDEKSGNFQRDASYYMGLLADSGMGILEHRHLPSKVHPHFRDFIVGEFV